MSSTTNQSELDRLYAIISATLTHSFGPELGRFVLDGYDSSLRALEKEKKQLEFNYKRKRPEILQHQLIQLTRKLMFRVDVNYNEYIKAETGYEIDIFSDLKKRVAAIIVQKEIRNQTEAMDISTMFSYNRQTQANDQASEQFWAMLSEYSVKEGGGSSFDDTLETEELVEEIQHFPHEYQPDFWETNEIPSPDGKSRFSITHQGMGEHSSTDISISIGNSGGTIYSTQSVHKEIKAFWKDSHTLVITIGRDYVAKIQHGQVSSFDYVVEIEYIFD